MFLPKGNKIKLIFALVSSLYSISLAANDNLLTVYGKANVSAQLADEGEGSFTELKSNASRLGVKGSEELNNGMEVFYKLEWQVDLADISGSDNIKSRNQFVGIKGHFGSVILGRNDTIFKQFHGKVDQFNDYEGDLKGLWKGENRMGDSITYLSPKFSGLSMGLTYIAEDDPDAEDGVSIGVHYGDKNLKKSKLYASIAADYDVKGYDNVGLTLQGKLGGWTLGTILHHQEEVTTGESKNGFTASAARSVQKWKLKAQVQTLEDDNSVSLGADYKFGKNTKFYAWYTNRDLEQEENKNWFAMGVEHKFSM